MSYPLFSLCVNDGRTGTPTGRVGAISLDFAGHDDVVLELYNDWEDERRWPECTITEDKLTMAGAAFHLKGWRQYAGGNWCWDRVAMHPKVAADFLNFLRRSGEWRLDAAWSEWFEWYDLGMPFEESDLEPSKWVTA